MYIAKACYALQNDAMTFGGSFVNLVDVACRLKSFCLSLNAILETEGDDYFDVFGELDFAPDSKLKLAPTISKLMKESFSEARRDDFSYSNGF